MSKRSAAAAVIHSDALRLPLATMAALGVLAVASVAHADPCKAIPDRGPPPAWAKAGYVASGTVRYVADGDSLCVGSTSNPQSWVEIRIADFDAPELRSPDGPEAKRTLERIAQGRRVVCTALRGKNGRVVSYDRLIAVCRINGASIGDLMRRAGVREGGNGR